MISVSQEVIDLINADSRTFRAKFKHGDSVYDKIMSLKWNVCLPSSSFSVGNALSIGIQCTAFDVPVSIKGEELELVITIEGSADEISIGSFTAEKPTIQNGIVSFNAYDDMSKAGNIPYNSTLGEGKHTVNQYVADVAATLGIGCISLGSEGEVTVENDYLSGNSCRNALAYLAGYLGRNCVIKNKKISMKKFTLVDYTMNADRIEEPELEDIDSEIDFIIAQISSNNTIMNGNGATGTELVCPIMTESQLSNVANMLFGDASPIRTYRSGKVKLLLGDPRLELCDVIKLDYKDTEYIIPITSISFEYDGGLMTDIEAYALKEPTLLTPSQRLDFAVQEEVKKVLEQLKNIDGTYFYIRYSPNDDGSNMTEEPDDKTEYIGVCSTNQSSAPGVASAYTWSKFKGKDGSSNFFHVKYSNDGGKTFTGTDGETAGEYIGILVDSNEDDSTNPSDYTWSKIVGKDGGTLQVKYKNSATAPAVTNNDVSGWSDEVPAPEKGKRTYMVQKLSNETNWSTPIQISAEDGTTPTVSINSNGYWVINGEATTVKAQGTNGKTPTITVGDNGNWFVDGVDTNTKAQGAQGKDGADIEYVYYRSSSSQTPSKPSYNGTTLSGGWTASPQGITETYKYEYVSVRTKPAGSTSWGAFSTPVIWSKWGEKGTDGDGVEYKYFLADVPGEYSYEAGDQTWTDEPTGVDKDWMYEYVVQIKHNGDGNTEISNPGTLWAKWGETGSPATAYSMITSSSVIAKSVSGSLSPYSITLSGKSKTGTSSPVDYACRFKIETTTDMSNWVESYKSTSNVSSHTYSVPSGIKALRCSMYLAGGTSTLLDQQVIPVVSDGTNGGDAYTVILSNESHTFVGDTEKALDDQETYISVIAYKGATQVKVSIETIEDVPTGMSTAIYQSDTVNAKFSVWITGTMTTKNGTLTIPVKVDGKTFNKQFSYSLALKGETGDEGNGITSVAVTYAKSSDGTSIPSSGWQSNVPSLSEGDYLWTKTVTNYKKTDPTTSYTVSRVGANGEKGKGVSSIVDYYTATTTSEDKLINGNGTVLVEEVSRTAGTNGVHHGSDDYYIIDMNQVDNSYCLIKLTLKLTATANVVLNCVSCGEHNTSTVYDYMMVSNISSSDSTYKLAESSSADSDAKLKKKFNVVSEQSTTPIQVSFGNYSAGTYYIYIKARKDSSTTKNEYFAFQCGTLFSGNNWTTYIPSDFNEKNPYLWKYTRINYDDGTHTETSKQIISHWGKTGKDGQNLYAESTTSANTQTKAAILKTGSLTSLTTGITVTVKFTNANTFSMPNLNVNSTGNYQIKWNKVTPTGDNPFYWPAGAVMTFVFDGSGDTKYWVVTDIGSTKMDMQSAGLVVGNYSSSGTLQNNVLIGASDVQIRNDQTVYAKFGTTVTIGRDTGTYSNIFIDSDSVDIRKGATTLASMAYHNDTVHGYGETFRISAPNTLYLTSDNIVKMASHYAYTSDGESCMAASELSISSKSGEGQISTSAEKTVGSNLYFTSLDLNSSLAKLRGYSYVDGTTKFSDLKIEPTAITLDTSYIYLNGESRIKNNTRLSMYDSLGTSRSVLLCGTGDYLDIGAGFWNGAAKGTVLYGKTLQFRVYPKGTGTTYAPYYSASTTTKITENSTGEKTASTTYGTTTTANISIMTAGFLTDGTKKVIYTVPLAKPVIGSPTVSVTSVTGFYLRQNDKYTHGSSWTEKKQVKPNKSTAYLAASGDLVYVEAEYSQDTTAINNSPIAIEGTITLSFS